MGRTVEQAERECREAWRNNPSDYGWCIHHEIEMEGLTEPIGNRISFIINNKAADEVVARLDNLRPVMSGRAIAAEKAHREATAQARKAYQEDTAPAWEASQEATAPAWEAYNEATTPAEKAYREAISSAEKAYQETVALAHAEDVPGHTWNGKSIF